MRRLFLNLVSLVPFVFKNLRFHQIHIGRHLIPSATFKCSSHSLFLNSTPLLEEKWDLSSQALISNICDPFLHDWSCPWADSPPTIPQLILNFVTWLAQLIICFRLYNFVIPI